MLLYILRIRITCLLLFLYVSVIKQSIWLTTSRQTHKTPYWFAQPPNAKLRSSFTLLAERSAPIRITSYSNPKVTLKTLEKPVYITEDKKSYSITRSLARPIPYDTRRRQKEWDVVACVSFSHTCYYSNSSNPSWFFFFNSNSYSSSRILKRLSLYL